MAARDDGREYAAEAGSIVYVFCGGRLGQT